MKRVQNIKVNLFSFKTSVSLMTEKNKYKRNGRQRQNGIKYNNNDIECNSSEQNKIC